MNKKVICLFDIDGTLTKPRNVIILFKVQFIEKSMIDCLTWLKEHADIGLVGGSDKKKII